MLGLIIAWLLTQSLAARKHPFAGKTSASRKAQLANLAKRPPPEKGERRRHVHGGRGNGQLSPRYPEILEHVTEVATEHAKWLLGTDVWVLEGFASILAGIDEMGTYLDEHGWLDERGQPRSVVRLYLRAISKASQEAEKLGFSPRARQALGLQAVSLASMMNPAPIRPRRDPEHLRQVAGILDSLGVLGPPPKPEPEEPSEVIEGHESQDDEPDYGDPTPPPLPESDRRDLGVRHIYDTGL
ncbi:MAG TPA: hypothetical protein VG294_00400 [Solirubrobacteraceae bacterium]|jgi:hypothetical protein|nr:hypothetical protein [Solirubrobacteraceae bacterium]